MIGCTVHMCVWGGGGGRKRRENQPDPSFNKLAKSPHQGAGGTPSGLLFNFN
jgi:hypothetical protein